jgi:hypothetical protein
MYQCKSILHVLIFVRAQLVLSFSPLGEEENGQQSLLKEPLQLPVLQAVVVYFWFPLAMAKAPFTFFSDFFPYLLYLIHTHEGRLQYLFLNFLPFSLPQYKNYRFNQSPCYPKMNGYLFSLSVCLFNIFTCSLPNLFI